MSSYYADLPDDEEVRVNPRREVRCQPCHGTGLVEVHGQETDCIDCEGYGSVLIKSP